MVGLFEEAWTRRNKFVERLASWPPANLWLVPD